MKFKMHIEEEIKKVNEELNTKHFVHIPGKIFREWLIYFGAKEEDLNTVEQGRVHSLMEVDPNPTMHFRQISFLRNLLIEDGLKKNGKTKYDVRNSGCQASVIFYENEIASSDTDGAALSMKRSGCRYWNTPPDNFVNSTIPYALSRVLECFIPNEYGLEEKTNIDSKFIIQDIALARINKTTDNLECPTPEGIHQDGTEIQTITLASFHHLEQGGDSRIWPLSTPKGCYSDEEFEIEDSPFYKKKCLFDYQLRKHWDTIVFNDRKVKHEARPFDGERPAYRDMIGCSIRKPNRDGYDKMLNENGDVVTIE